MHSVDVDIFKNAIPIGPFLAKKTIIGFDIAIGVVRTFAVFSSTKTKAKAQIAIRGIDRRTEILISTSLAPTCRESETDFF